jgi:AcrR family transcriptional regulator
MGADAGRVAAMSDKEPRTERGRKTRRRLIEAAAQEFGERGYHDAAITGITQRADAALGTFYTYFDTKEEVFRALVRDMSHSVRSHVAEAVKGAPDRLAAERMGLEAFIAFVRRHRELYRIIASIISPSPTPIAATSPRLGDAARSLLARRTARLTSRGPGR